MNKMKSIKQLLPHLRCYFTTCITTTRRKTADSCVLQQWVRDLARSLSPCQSAPWSHTYRHTGTLTHRQTEEIDR